MSVGCFSQATNMSVSVTNGKERQNDVSSRSDESVGDPPKVEEGRMRALHRSVFYKKMRALPLSRSMA